MDQETVDLANVGMLSALYARQKPDRPALIDKRGSRTFAGLHARANQFARALQLAGLEPGDGMAFACRNRIEWVEVYLAGLRVGLRVTPINWHLTPDEVAYIVADSRAKALIVEDVFAEAGRKSLNPSIRLAVAIGAQVEGFDNLEAVLSAQSSEDPSSPSLGTTMIYTSGTTGRPKGVFRKGMPVLPMLEGTIPDFHPDTDVSMCCGPAYHGGPLTYDIRVPQAAGVPIVLLERFDPEAVLASIQEYRVTHAHMVATMFQRLLALPADVRARYDVSSMRRLFHGAAPTPRHVKYAMIKWFGPVLGEYYAATEGQGAFYITSEEWLRKPGSVGRLQPEHGAMVLDDAGAPCAPGQVGHVHFRDNPEAPFQYFGDPEKTRSAFRGSHFTVGDMGYVDEDGYLFLTGRTAECIISGGVNIYPQEIDDVLLQHPAVVEACTIGVPNEEWGEEVKSLVVLAPDVVDAAAVPAELMAFVRTRLASYKAPKSVDVVASLPRMETGKIRRSEVRRPFWAGRAASI